MNNLLKHEYEFSPLTELLLKIFASTLFLVLGYSLFNFHEPWRDELQAFSLVRNSHSLTELIDWVRYEGHPLGWYIIQKIIFQFNQQFYVIRVVHFLLASLGILIFLWKMPISIIYRIVIFLGYFFIYEYTSIARNYGIALPFYAIICILFSRRNFLLFGLVIALTMQFSLYSFIIAFTVALFYFYTNFTKKNPTYYAGIACSILGVVIFKYVVNPPNDIGTSPGWNISPDNYTAAFSVIANAFLPVFKFDINFWNSSIFEMILSYNLSQAIQFIITIFLLSAIIQLFKKQKTSLLIFLIGTAIMMFFIAAKYHGSIRHHGHIYILLLMSIWISKTISTDIKLPFTLSEKIRKKVLFFPEKYIPNVIQIVLICQMIGSAQAFYFEKKYPFSASNQAADFLNKNYPTKQIIACNDDACTSVAILMNKKIYHANTGAYREHLIFNSQRGDICFDTLINRTNRFFLTNPDGLLLLSKSNATYSFISKMPYKLVYSTTEAIRHDESYLVYTQK